MTIEDIINEIFDSQEMKTYLCENVELLHKHHKKEMIAGSPMITIQRKLQMFEWLAKEEDLDKELSAARDAREREYVKRSSYAEIVKNTHEAIRMLYDTKKQSVFLVRTLVNWGNRDDECEEAELIPVTSYEKALQYMRKQEKEYGNNRIWFDVEKWEQDENGNLEHKNTYIVVKGQIIYFHHHKNHYNECAPDKDVNLPVPFMSGDIVEVSDMPFARMHHVLILNIGDNKDCCAVSQLYIDEDGCIKANAFKHGYVFDSWYATSPLYKAKTFKGILKGEEEVLHRVHDFMEGLSENDKNTLIINMLEHFSENMIRSKDITEELLSDVKDKVLAK